MEIKIRPEQVSEQREVEELTREAFWNVYMPGCDEHYLLHILRTSECFLPELNMVAEVEGKIVGHIAYTKAKIVLNDGGERVVIALGLSLSCLNIKDRVGQCLNQAYTGACQGCGICCRPHIRQPRLLPPLRFCTGPKLRHRFSRRQLRGRASGPRTERRGTGRLLRSTDYCGRV